VQGRQPSHLHFWTGWLIETRMADPAAYAQAQIDEWHKRLKAGGSARPSPTIDVPQRAGYERLVVEARAVWQSKRISWELLKRPPETPLVDLTERLVCQRCGENGPLPTITGSRADRLVSS
jgi:hypothetical protein